VLGQQAWGWVAVHPLVVLWEGLRSLGAVVGQREKPGD